MFSTFAFVVSYERDSYEEFGEVRLVLGKGRTSGEDSGVKLLTRTIYPSTYEKCLKVTH